MHPIRLVLFDITGTILSDAGHVVRAFGTVLRKHGISANEDDLREWRGAAKQEIIHHFVARQLGSNVAPDDPRLSRIYDDFRRQLDTEFETLPADPIPGAEAAFDWLRDRGIMIGTTTGYHRKLSDLLLSRAGWLDKFQTTVASDEVATGRPAPYMIFHAMEAARVTSVSAVITVGDTPLDLRAGANAGVRGIIGVLSGAHRAERLEREPHTHILASVAELPAVVASIQ